MDMRIPALVVAALVAAPACTILGIGGSGQQSQSELADPDEVQDEPEPEGEPEAPKPAKEPTKPRVVYEEVPEDEDEESGVRRINRYLRNFKHALNAKDFASARAFLIKAQIAVGKASDLIRAHPDFDELEESVGNARVRLDMGIETDRIERRESAIDDLMRRGGRTRKEGDRLYVALAQRVPTEADVEGLDALLRTLDGLKSEGREYMSEPRYQEHADERHTYTEALRKVREETRWHVDAINAVALPIQNGVEAGVEGNAAETVDQKIQAMSRAASSFRSCANVIVNLQNDRLFKAKKKLRTRLGEMTFGRAKRRCVELSTQARKNVDSLRWYRDVIGVVEHINAALTQARAPTNAADALAASKTATDALAKCTLKLEAIEHKAGYDPHRSFETLLGEVAALPLREACKRERGKILKTLPGLTWRTTIRPLIDTVNAAKTRMDTAVEAKTGAEGVKMWEAALGSVKECIDQVRAHAKKPGAQRSLELDTAYGRINISAIEKTCVAKRAAAQKALKAALKRREVEDFAAARQADEKVVVTREGIPTRIETFVGGRVLIYEKPGSRGKKEVRRFGFDGQGTRVDFWVQWRNTVVNVVSELTRVLAAVRKAPDATATFKAVEEAVPVLEVCKEVLETAKGSPGYDPKATFKTTLGKLTVPKLIPACTKEKSRLKGTIDTLKWRVRLERLRDRVNESQAQMGKAQKATSPDERLTILSSAVGGLKECVERGEALPKEHGADKSYKTPSVHGRLDVFAITRTCQSMLARAQKAADQALEDKKTATFVATCAGDEIEVARREGVPYQIERIGSGRVFIYKLLPKGKKKKKKKPASKRFAFDAKGKRVDEKLLRAEIDGQPEVVERIDSGDTVPVPDLTAPKKRKKKKR